jgi:succinyl-CoA synthetase beta subunit
LFFFPLICMKCRDKCSCMKIHEYQAKSLLGSFGITVPEGIPIRNSSEARDVSSKLGFPVALKAQIHAGGRGKAGGVKLAANPREAESISEELLGKKLYSPQTGPEGKRVNTLLLEQGIEIDREFYLGLLVDRESGRILIMASTEGGVEIEKVAAENPGAIIRQYVDVSAGLSSFQSRNLAFALGVNPRGFEKLLTSLYRAFLELDCSMIELNPLVLTTGRELVALDAKMNFDDNSLYRHPEVVALRDYEEEDPLEIKASRFNLNYIRLDGYIGCMVNGAGLAMATMDIIKLAGGSPANFLDVGGGANTEQVKNAFSILVSDSRVRAVLINIFGGIMRCDTVAEGIVQSVAETGIKLPVVIRLEGTNVTEGRRILEESGLQFTIADNMKDAAEKVVLAADSTGDRHGNTGR